MLSQGIIKYSLIPNKVPYTGVPSSEAYLALPYFSNWVVGFTVAEGSFVIKTRGDVSFQLRQRTAGHIELFKALTLLSEQ